MFDWTLFHPYSRAWFVRTFKQPSLVQQEAWSFISKKKHTLIAAPTGSGKTFAAFFAIIDDLFRRAITGQIEPRPYVLYVSPLKALSHDIEKNLEQPLQELNQLFSKEALFAPIRAQVRTGDTPASVRAKMIKKPPHIIVTTPESLYLLLGSDSGCKLLACVETVIIDEIHALVPDKRGLHLMLSIERLVRLLKQPLMRIGISATQQPIDVVARFLVGTANVCAKTQKPDCQIVNHGHARALDIALVLPQSALSSLMTQSLWQEVDTQLCSLINTHKTTIIFVNTRRLCERLALRLKELLGESCVRAHHGSLSRTHRLEAEQMLKQGQLKVLVATASLELGIDIGQVDLVCQISSPRSISVLLQRVGRSRHQVGGIPKGRIFPLTRDDLVECVSILDAINRQELDQLNPARQALDVLCQQCVAMVAMHNQEESGIHEDEIYKWVCSVYAYRDITKKQLKDCINLLAQGFSHKRTRRHAHLYYDVQSGMVQARKGAKLLALMNGGTIPDTFDFEVRLMPEQTLLGSVHEDFAIESMVGDVFQLGNHAWRIVQITKNSLQVIDAQGQNPSIPFWLGESQGRSDAVSFAVSRLRTDIDAHFKADLVACTKEVIRKVEKDYRLTHEAAQQLVSYLALIRASLGCMPSQSKLVIERFFDEAGDTHIVIHSPFGSRMNRAFGLALRKCFCRQFNFELQAAAHEDAIILSLSQTHSFSLMDVFFYLHKNTVRHVLIQALLVAPMFQLRWRYNATRALAIVRRMANKPVPAAIQRIQAEDLMAILFPDQIACAENLAGERQVPQTPLVLQTIDDCLHDAMDIDALIQLLDRICEKKITLEALDLRTPSALSAEIIQARPYAFLDDTPLEERRVRAITLRQQLSAQDAQEMAYISPHAVFEVAQSLWPDVRNWRDLHDLLMGVFCLTQQEIDGHQWASALKDLCQQQRACVYQIGSYQRIIAYERIPYFVWIDAEYWSQPEQHALKQKALSSLPKITDKSTALRDIVRGRLEISTPLTAHLLAQIIHVEHSEVLCALAELEKEGFVFKGHFLELEPDIQFCERYILSCLNKITLKSLRKSIEPVLVPDFMRFLLAWQHVEKNQQPVCQNNTLVHTLLMLEGYPVFAEAWETCVLRARLQHYNASMMDYLMASGQFVLARLGPVNLGKKNYHRSSLRHVPMTFVRREKINHWRRILNKNDSTQNFLDRLSSISSNAKQIFEVLRLRGACFVSDLVRVTGLLPTVIEQALIELLAMGLVCADGLMGIRSFVFKKQTHMRVSSRLQRMKTQAHKIAVHHGRFSLMDWVLDQMMLPDTTHESENLSEDVALLARCLLQRYGVVFRSLYEHEHVGISWWSLLKVYRHMELRGEVRAGRFVDSQSGEQFATQEAITLLRAIREDKNRCQRIEITASDPLNLTGVLLKDEARVPAHHQQRIVYEEGQATAIFDGRHIHFLKDISSQTQMQIRSFLIYQSNLSV